MAYKVTVKDPSAPGGKRWTGLWRAEVELPNGKRVTRTDPLKRVVDAWADEQRVAIRRGQWRDPRDSRITVTAWHERWWAARIGGRRTLERNAEVWRLYVEPKWGGCQLEAITRMEVQGWAKQLLADLVAKEAAAATAAKRDPRPGAGLRTVQQAVSLLSMLLQAALEEDPPVLASGRNPCRGVVAELPPPTVRPPQYFTAEQHAAILAELVEPWRTLADFATFTGLRWGEVSALRIRSVDWLHELVHVYHVRERDGTEREYPKSRKSRRTVPMPAHCTAALRDLTAGRGPDALVFADAAGAPLSYWSLQTVWERAVADARTCGNSGCRDAGHHVPAFSPHTMRHTAASWLVMAGVDLYRVQALLGHESYVTTQRYAHLAPDAHDAVRGVWAALRPTPRPHEATGGGAAEVPGGG